MVGANYEVAPEFLAQRPQVVLMKENALIEPIFVEMEPFCWNGIAGLRCTDKCPPDRLAPSIFNDQVARHAGGSLWKKS